MGYSAARSRTAGMYEYNSAAATATATTTTAARRRQDCGAASTAASGTAAEPETQGSRTGGSRSRSLNTTASADVAGTRRHRPSLAAGDARHLADDVGKLLRRAALRLCGEQKVVNNRQAAAAGGLRRDAGARCCARRRPNSAAASSPRRARCRGLAGAEPCWRRRPSRSSMWRELEVVRRKPPRAASAPAAGAFDALDMPSRGWRGRAGGSARAGGAAAAMGRFVVQRMPWSQRLLGRRQRHWRWRGNGNGSGRRRGSQPPGT